MTRFYVSYLQDCGFGAGMHCHDVVEAENWKEVYENFEDLIRAGGKSRGTNYSVQSVGTPTACFQLFDQEETRDDVLTRFTGDTLGDDCFIDPRAPIMEIITSEGPREMKRILNWIKRVFSKKENIHMLIFLSAFVLVAGLAIFAAHMTHIS